MDISELYQIYQKHPVITTEKHASHLYDTCIFEFKQENIRTLLNGIQKEEQNPK